MERRKRKYPSDMSKKEWRIIKELLPEEADNQALKLKDILNALFYINKTGCHWRYLPSEYPAWSSVNYHFNKWSKDGTLKRINVALCKKDREKRGRNQKPSAAIIDAQSVKTAKEAQEVGFDGGKLIKGHKRHSLTDTVGNMLNVVVTAANVSDTAGGKLLLSKIMTDFPSIKHIWADGGYKEGFIAWVKDKLQATVEIVKRETGQKGFVVQVRRWVVERTFAWLNNYRRLSKDYERLTVNSEGMIFLASIKTMLQRIAA